MKENSVVDFEEKSRIRMSVVERIRKLPYEHEIRDMAFCGMSASYITSYIKDVHGDFAEMQKEQLRQGVERYLRATISQEDAVKRLPKWMTLALVEKINVMKEKLDELEQLETLYKMQLDRIKIDYETEKGIKKLFATTHREFITAADILHKSFSIKQALGIVDVGGIAPKAITVHDEEQKLLDAEKRFGSNAVDRVLKNPESRRKLLNALEVMSKAQANKVEQVPDDNVVMIDSVRQ